LPYYRGGREDKELLARSILVIIVTDLIIAVVILLERDINRLVVEAREVLEPVKLWDKG